MRPLRAWLVITHSGGSGAPVGRQQDRSAGSLLDETGANARARKPGPELSHRRKPLARAAVERREASALRQGREAPRTRLACRVMGTPRVPRRQPERFSALRSPRFPRDRESRRTRRLSNNTGGGALAFAGAV